MWICPHCENDSDDSFDVCWACGASRDGAPDPDFHTADEPERMSEAPEAVNSPSGLVECYRASSDLEARFVADRLIEAGLPAAPGSARPKFGMYLSDAPCVQVRPEDLARAREWVEGYELKLRERRRRAEPPRHEERPEELRPLPGREDDRVECYQARNAMEAARLADELNEQGIPAVSDLNDLHRSIGNLHALPRVRVRARDLAKAREWVEAYDASRGDADVH